MRRDAVAMLFWALRWHEGHRVAYRVLHDVLWGGSVKPTNPTGALREIMARLQARHGQRWIVEDCAGRAFRILPRRNAPGRAASASPGDRRTG